MRVTLTSLDFPQVQFGLWQVVLAELYFLYQISRHVHAMPALNKKTCSLQVIFMISECVDGRLLSAFIKSLSTVVMLHVSVCTLLLCWRGNRLCSDVIDKHSWTNMIPLFCSSIWRLSLFFMISHQMMRHRSLIWKLELCNSKVMSQ